MNPTAKAYCISMLLLMMFLFTSQIISSFALNTINMTHVLKDGETMISSGGSFELGFFSPGTSSNRYVGIWYKKDITAPTILWVANRGSPLTNTTGSLKLIHPGNLVLEAEGYGIIWSTSNTSNTVPNPVAQLLDTGNLVIKDANDNNPNNFLWQSFNYPTNTFLPGMKLGWNLVTRQEVYISSWRSEEDPAQGSLTLNLDPTGYPQLELRRGGEERYRAGSWNGIGFSGTPFLRENTVYRIGLVMNENEVYYYFDLVNSSVLSRFTMNPNGIGLRYTWSDQMQSWEGDPIPRLDTCDTYRLCGAYASCYASNSPSCSCLDRFVPNDSEAWSRGNWSSGCIRRKVLNREDGGRFFKYLSIKLPDTRRSWFNRSMSLNECKMLCSTNSSCMAYANLDVRSGGSGCLVWYGDLVDMKHMSENGQDIYIKMASSELGTEGRKQEILIISISVLTGLILLGVILMVYAWRRKRINHQLARKDIIRLGSQRYHCDSKDMDLPLFDLDTINKATDNFSIDNKLGEGGFGPVYKGMLKERQEVAVKRLSTTSFQGVDEFKNEMTCIAKHQHRNLVKLLGCCIEGDEKILVYEYMSNRSLDLIIFDPVKNALLDWPKRFHIINGIARGLMYLHQDSRLRIIHRDLKASNILLDSDMNPKISDFGLARSFGGNETGANTSHVVGTYGYMSPEYAIDGMFSVKSDVFSFGVLVLEIVTGKKNRGFSHRDHHLNLLGHTWLLYREGNSLEISDSDLGRPQYISEATRSIHIGLLCVQQYAEDRPTMSAVVMMLGNEAVLPEAKQPGFFTERDVKTIDASISSNAASSVNEMSITQAMLEGR